MNYCKSFCTGLLRGARDHLKRFPFAESKLKGMYVDRAILFGGKRYFWVRLSDHKLIWEGSTCCVYHAKVKAIDKILEV